MSRPDLERVLDALEHAVHAQATIETHGVAILRRDVVVLRAIAYDLIVVGTTLGKVSDAFKDACPDLPWRDVVDARNRLVHAYWQIDPIFMAALARSKPPDLILKLQMALVETDSDPTP